MAQDRPLVAVLDFAESNSGLKRHELQLLTDLARGTALEVVGGTYDIITRENLVDLLRAHGKTLEQCKGECETETGRLIGAEVVVSGRIVKAFGALQVSLKVHRTSPPKLLGTKVTKAKRKNGLERAVQDGVRALLIGLAARPADGGSRPGWNPKQGVRLRLETRPPGAAVRLGGLETTSPVDARVPPGTHRLTISLPWYRTITTQVTVPEDEEELKLTYDLVPSSGRLELRVSPDEAEVMLDDSVVGRGTTTLERVAPGVHEVRIRRAGYHDRRVILRIQPGKTTRRRVDLKRRTSDLAADDTVVVTEQTGSSNVSVWVVGGVSAAAGVGGLVAWLVADSDLEAVREGRAGDMPQQEAFDLENRAGTLQGVAIGLWAAASVGATVALVLSSGNRKRTSQWRIDVQPTTTGGLVSIGGEF